MRDLRGEQLKVPKFKHSIVDSFKEVLSAVGLENGKIVPGEFDKCIFFIVDGFGHQLMNSFGILDNLGMETHEIGSVLPSMTATCLSSIFSGVRPAEHGVLGARFYLPEAGNWIKPLSFTTVDNKPVSIKSPDLLLTNKLWDVMSDSSIGVRAIKPAHVGKTFSKAFFPDEIIELVKGSEGFDTALKKFLNSEDSIAIPYWENPDLLLHWGHSIDEVKENLREIFGAISALSTEKNADKTCLIIMGDHGMTKLNNKIDFKEIDHLWDGVPEGKSRQRMAFTKDANAVAEALPGVHVLNSKNALDSGLFGKPHERVSERMGDLILFAKEKNAMLYDGPDHVYAHGSLNEEELSTSFAFCRLSDFKPSI